MGKCPKEPKTGDICTVESEGKAGKRIVKLEATGKQGFGKWKIISNKKA